ncbi:PPM-type phosphatase domain protein [Raphanus sativus]|nr:PPM-type phosphatase domain protein [Raphanus sativus]
MSSEPDIRDVIVDSRTDVLVLAASDGIWKVMTNEESVEIAKRKYPQRLECAKLFCDCRTLSGVNASGTMKRFMKHNVCLYSFHRGLHHQLQPHLVDFIFHVHFYCTTVNSS